MDPDRISALLEPFLGPPGDRRVSTDDLDKMSAYIDLLLRWNARINLTAIREPEQIIPRHFGESLFMARLLFPGAGAGSEPVRSKIEARRSRPLHVIDIGSGAGFPALPIKIWEPEIHLTMIESNHKKAAFLREAARELKLTDVNVIAERAESVAARLSSASEVDAPATKNKLQPAEIVTFRAVERFNQILPLATKFLAKNGRLAILTTQSRHENLQSLPSITWSFVCIPQSQIKTLAVGWTKWPHDRQ
jgi:16S rRNA (guanine527-N7)-methyltransferase